MRGEDPQHNYTGVKKESDKKIDVPFMVSFFKVSSPEVRAEILASSSRDKIKVLINSLETHEIRDTIEKLDSKLKDKVICNLSEENYQKFAKK